MRRATALLLLALASRAEAESIPIAIAPFSTRCFDAQKLAERVRGEVGELPVAVAVGAAARGSSAEVHVSEAGTSLLVVVTARGPRREVSGSARRLVPGADCTTALEVAALIVTRAALPLNWQRPPPAAPPPRPTPPAPPPRPAPPAKPTRPSPREAVETPPAPAPPPPPATGPAPVAEPAPIAPAPPRPFVAPPRVIVREVQRPALREPGTIVLRTRVPERRLVGELGVAAYGFFPLDGNGANEPGGELSLGFRRRHFGAALRGAVEGDYSQSAPTPEGPVTLSIRRSEVALEAHADVPVRVGALRFVVGPAMPLWNVRSSGVLPRPRSSLVVSAAATARVLYRIDLRRVFVTAGVSAEVAFLREQFTVTGLGKISETPLLEIGPVLGVGVNL